MLGQPLLSSATLRRARVVVLPALGFDPVDDGLVDPHPAETAPVELHRFHSRYPNATTYSAGLLCAHQSSYRKVTEFGHRSGRRSRDACEGAPGPPSCF